MEASVMLGRQINFNKARELMMAGDMVGAQKEILKQVGLATVGVCPGIPRDSPGLPRDSPGTPPGSPMDYQACEVARMGPRNTWGIHVVYHAYIQYL